MTERTHDLAALTMLTVAVVFFPPVSLTIGTLAAAVIANQFGSAVPDFDQPTAEFYRELPAGTWIGRLFAPLFGGHRYISHSLVGAGVFGWLFWLLLTYLSSFVTVDMNIVWWAFILGYFSHLVMDTITKEGVPWLFPIPVRIGFPPFRFLRVDTGKFIEKMVIYPGLAALNGYLIYANYSKFSVFFATHLLK